MFPGDIKIKIKINRKKKKEREKRKKKGKRENGKVIFINKLFIIYKVYRKSKKVKGKREKGKGKLFYRRRRKHGVLARARLRLKLPYLPTLPRYARYVVVAYSYNV